jgi:REP element-mobilizing transposase RayT
MSQSDRHLIRKPLRRAGFDYANCGMYFITICVQHMESRFGHINDNQAVLNGAGLLIASTWEANAARYDDTALDQFVVMPNHMHAILFLGIDPEITRSATTLSRIVQSFKSISTVRYVEGVRSGEFPPFDRVLWQRGFHDRILRNDRELDIARRYIENNPANAEQRFGAVEQPHEWSKWRTSCRPW